VSLTSLYKSQVKSAQAKLKSVRSTRDRKRRSYRDAEKNLGQLKKRIGQTRSESQKKSYESQAESKSRQVDSARQAFVGAEEDVSKAEEKLAEVEQKLQKQEEADEKAAERKAKQSRQRQKQKERLQKQQKERQARQTENERIAREAARDEEIRHLGDRASDLELRLLEAELKAAPAEVTVLFLASSPKDEPPLRLDKETREIQKRMRSSGFPESIFIEWRLARQLPDLVQDLNEVRPNVLHFSGHGNSGELAFEDKSEKAVSLTNEQLLKLLTAAPERIRLVLFNSCNSAAQAELATAHVELAIGMEAPVGDRVAQTFAGQFYNSLGFGLSVAQAFEQAVLQIEMEHGAGHEVPKLFFADDVDPATVVLVNPENEQTG
jgi:myosin heavy subunit